MSESPEVTPDGRYVVVNGRRWRAGVQAAKVALGERGPAWWDQS